MKNIEIKIVGGFFAVILIVVIIAFWRDGSKDVSREQVVIQQVIDSLTKRHNAEIIAREDSIQREAYSNIALLQAEKDKQKAIATKAEKKLKEQSNTIQELEAQYAEQCGELITEYREREQTALTIIESKNKALITCESTVSQQQNIITSAGIQIATLNKTIEQKNKTISTQKDRLTTITNRSKRNFIFRNWKWVTGRWREFVLE